MRSALVLLAALWLQACAADTGDGDAERAGSPAQVDQEEAVGEVYGSETTEPAPAIPSPATAVFTPALAPADEHSEAPPNGGVTPEVAVPPDTEPSSESDATDDGLPSPVEPVAVAPEPDETIPSVEAPGMQLGVAGDATMLGTQAGDQGTGGAGGGPPTEPPCDALGVLPLPDESTWLGPLTTISAGDAGSGDLLDPSATLHISFDDPGYRDCALRVPAHVQWISDTLTFEVEASLELTTQGGSLVAYVAPGSLQTTLDVPTLDRFEPVSQTPEAVWCEPALGAGSGELPNASGIFLNLELTAHSDDARVRLTWARMDGGPELAFERLPVACGQLASSGEL